MSKMKRFTSNIVFNNLCGSICIVFMALMIFSVIQVGGLVEYVSDGALHTLQDITQNLAITLAVVTIFDPEGLPLIAKIIKTKVKKEKKCK